MVGVTGLAIRRDLFYEKELSFQVSCSYGPGRYDKLYEQDCIDYPFGYVRWTENRNFEAILNSMSKGDLITKNLISHKFRFENSIEAFNLLSSKKSSLGILLEYENKDHAIQNTITLDNYSKKNKINHGTPSVGIIGAGNYTKTFLLPQLNNFNVDFTSIVASNGIEPLKLAKKYKFKKASTDQEILLSDKKTNIVIIATRHNSHGNLVNKSLLKNKHVYVEKPLCINSKELELIKKVYSGKNILMVGYNRRFSPLTIILKNELNKLNGRKSFIYTINAGKVPAEHWVNDSRIGGGRLLGEACHFVDLLRFLANSSIKDIRVDFLGKENYLSENFSLTLKFEDDSLGIIHYFSNGSRSFPKERLEVFCQEKIIQLNNFKSLKAWGIRGFKNINFLNQDKGQRSCIENFLNAVSGKSESPIPVEEIFEVQSILLKVCNL